jgi:hypothetical protein
MLAAASFLRWAVLDISSLITWAAMSSNAPGPPILNENYLLWWIFAPAGLFVFYQWAVFLHKRFTGHNIRLPLLHRMTLGLAGLLHTPSAFVHVRHLSCSSYHLIPAPVLFEGCSNMCIPPPAPAALS